MGLPIGKTALLLHCDGANGSTAIPDSSATPKTVTANGGAQISTTGPQMGSGSLSLNGVSSYVDVAAHDDIGIGTKDFTVEFFIKTTRDVSGITPLARIICDRVTSNVGGEFKLWQVGSAAYGPTVNGIALGSESGESYIVGTTSSANDGAWHHIAFCRSNVNYCAFFDGVLQRTAQATAVNYHLGAVSGYRLGARSDLYPGSFFDGQIDEFHMTVGWCKYTANFTPPTAPLTAETYYTESALTDGPLIGYTGAGLGMVGPGPADNAKPQPFDDHVLDALPYGFPASESSKLYNKLANSTDGTPEPFFDQIGYGTIVGTIKEKSTPANIPRKCRVFLYRHSDNRLVRTVWSDAAGNYEFRGVNPGFKYMALAVDPLGLYRAVVADNLTPDAIPQP